MITITRYSIATALLSLTIISTSAADEISGITEPVRSVIVASPVHGEIEQLHIKPGSRVEPGKLLLSLNNRMETLEAEKLKLIWQDTNGVEAASNRKVALIKLFEASHTLFKQGGSISKEALKREEMDVKQAEAEYQHMLIAEKKEGIEYTIAEEARKLRLINSPISGTVTQLHKQRGERCQPGEPLLEIVDTSRGVFIANIEEHLGQKLQQNQSVELFIASGNDTVVRKGEVSYLSPMLDAASGYMEVRVEFDNRDHAIRPGANAVLQIK